jgi:hypothetical protein
LNRRKEEKQKGRRCRQTRTAGMWGAGRSDLEGEMRGYEERGGVERRGDGCDKVWEKGESVRISEEQSMPYFALS